MNKPHKHAEVIKAWADGAEIEYRVHGNSEWQQVEIPRWFERYEYRVKPAPKTIRLMIYKNGDVVRLGENPQYAAFNVVAIKTVTYTEGEGL